MDSVIIGAGIEARHTASILRLQVEKALKQAEKTAQIALNTAGMEARQTLQQGSKEVRETSLVISKEVNANIKTAREETEHAITHCGQEVQRLLEHTRQQALQTILQGGDGIRAQLCALIRSGNCPNRPFYTEYH